jgi:spectinomycin phosphotransferase
MLEKPDLPDEKLVTCLQEQYGLCGVRVTFLPLGADRDTAVYRAVAGNEATYFVKLRRGIFDEMSVALPKLLIDQGIAQIIAPLATQDGRLWTTVDPFTLILYPFIQGYNGFELSLADHHWRKLGTALKRIHATVVPPALARRIPQETFPAQARARVKTFLARIAESTFDDPTSVQLAAFLQARHAELSHLIERAEQLANALANRTLKFVLCHTDIHARNVLIDINDDLYIVDWDNPIFAPKERDLMFIGGGVGGVWHSAHEEALFYQGYGQTEVDPIVLAYYRYNRIIEDIAIYCEQIFLTREGGEDREQALRYVISNFLPNNTIEMAYRSDKRLRNV